jgi:type II secretory pathway pseudopilin PulG
VIVVLVVIAILVTGVGAWLVYWGNAMYKVQKKQVQYLEALSRYIMKMKNPLVILGKNPSSGGGFGGDW